MRYDLTTDQSNGEFLYLTDRVAFAPEPSTGFTSTGLVDLLALGNGTTLLALERSFPLGRPGGGNTIKLYEVSLIDATDISSIPSLTAIEAEHGEQTMIHPAQKRLLLDLNDLGLANGLNNVEGIAVGPKLPNGLQSLTLVSDDNFNLGNIPQVPFLEFTQFLVFGLDVTLPQTLISGAGDDPLVGDRGSDSLNGADGNDTLIGINLINLTSVTRPGLNEIDTLTGGTGADTFVLGDSNRLYYNAGMGNAGIRDYALITDFCLGDDVLQLTQTKPEQRFTVDYVLGASPQGLPIGVGLFADTDGIIGLSDGDELIAVLQGLSLEDAATLTTRFSFV